MEWIVYLTGIALLTAFDVVTSGSIWHVFYFVTTAALGIAVLSGRVPEWALGLLSLAATVALVAVGSKLGVLGTFGLAECFILLVVIIVTSRQANGLIGWGRVALIVVALLCVPLRILSPDSLAFVIVLIAGVGCALAAGAVLRNLDGERRLALAVATQDERDRFARELHDDFTNRVTGMVLMVQATRRSLVTTPVDVDTELARVEAAGSEALVAMRRWVATLRESEVERDQELSGTVQSDVRSLLAQWEATSSAGRARFTDGIRGHISPELETTVHRIVQEAVTNASRHAPGAPWLDVSLAEKDGTCILEVINPLDTQPGVDPAPGSSGLGIIGMHERARVLDGVVEAGPKGPSLWSVRATFPIGAGS